MKYCLFSICIVALIIDTNTYVLLQVRKKDGNHSNIDAIIHKVVPAGKYDEIAKNISVKKQKTEQNDPENHEMRAKDDYRVRRNHENQSDNVKSTFIRTDSNEEVNEDSLSNTNNFKVIMKTLFDIVKNNGKAILRAGAKNIDIKPEVIRFRNENPSMIFELKLEGIIKTINDFLSSKIFINSVDNLTRRAAVVYRAVNDKMKAD